MRRCSGREDRGGRRMADRRGPTAVGPCRFRVHPHCCAERMAGARPHVPENRDGAPPSPVPPPGGHPVSPPAVYAGFVGDPRHTGPPPFTFQTKPKEGGGQSTVTAAAARRSSRSAHAYRRETKHVGERGGCADPKPADGSALWKKGGPSSPAPLSTHVSGCGGANCWVGQPREQTPSSACGPLENPMHAGQCARARVSVCVRHRRSSAPNPGSRCGPVQRSAAEKIATLGRRRRPAAFAFTIASA